MKKLYCKKCKEIVMVKQFDEESNELSCPYCKTVIGQLNDSD